jgi:acyl-CoA synthetase (NDP forming)
MCAAFQAVRRVRAGVGEDEGDGVFDSGDGGRAVETIVGVATDPLFGPLVGFGPGGARWN